MDNDLEVDNVLLTDEQESSPLEQYTEQSEDRIESFGEPSEPYDLAGLLDKSNLDDSIIAPIDFIEPEEPAETFSSEFLNQEQEVFQFQQPVEDEWEECEDEPFIWWWRIVATMIAITLVAAVFYLLQRYRQKQSVSESNESTSVEPKEQFQNGKASSRDKSDFIADRQEFALSIGKSDRGIELEINKTTSNDERQIAEEQKFPEQVVEKEKAVKQLKVDKIDNEEIRSDNQSVQQKNQSRIDEKTFPAEIENVTEQIGKIVEEAKEFFHAKADSADKKLCDVPLAKIDHVNDDKEIKINIGEIQGALIENVTQQIGKIVEGAKGFFHADKEEAVKDIADKELHDVPLIEIDRFDRESEQTANQNEFISVDKEIKTDISEVPGAVFENITEQMGKIVEGVKDFFDDTVDKADKELRDDGVYKDDKEQEIKMENQKNVPSDELSHIHKIPDILVDDKSLEEHDRNSTEEMKPQTEPEAFEDRAKNEQAKIPDFTPDKQELQDNVFEDEVNITFSLKNNELQKSQGAHNAVIESEFHLPVKDAYQDENELSEEISTRDLPRFEIELYDGEEHSEEKHDGLEPKYEEEQEEEEESEEFGENTTAPEIESYEAMVEAEAELSEKEVEDVELEDEDILDDDEHHLEKEAIYGEQISQQRSVPASSPIIEHIAQQPAFVPSKDQNLPKTVFENGTRRNEDHENDDDELDEKYGGQNSILEIIGAQSIEEVLMKMDTLDAVAEVMRMAGLESSNLIFGIDYTASNKYQGEMCFGGKSLHTIEAGLLNPYQQVITILGKTLAPFASSGFIAAYGFGDVKCSDVSVFPLKAQDFCHSFDEVLNVYTTVTPKIILSGPTNFAPLIYQSMEICKQVKDYHILVIVADGQVTNERATRRAIVDACKYPISIIVVGVGDGPWDMMRVFDDSLPKRPWDNFHFVEFHHIAGKSDNPDLAFAVQSLLEIPDQYKKIKAMGLLNFSDTD